MKLFFYFLNKCIGEDLMNIIPQLLREIKQNPALTQRELALHLNISLGSTNKYIHELEEQRFLEVLENGYSLTAKGSDYLEGYRVDNAIIIAAGFGSRFVPLTYETPKGLLEVFGERMIERQIKQLHEVGITDITIMVGYLKEKFDYLIDKYNVKLIYNPEYATKNTLATLWHARHLFKNTYILSSDNWIRENIFHTYEPCAWYSGVYMRGNTSEWCLSADKKGRITDVVVGGADSYVMYGPVYFDCEFSERFIPLLEKYYNSPGTENFYWEQVYMENLKALPMYLYPQPDSIVYEFENLEELRLFDTRYQNHSDNVALEKISEIFSVPESEIVNIKCLKAGMTNKSFLFSIGEDSYIFRIPGPGTDLLINRQQEKAVYSTIAPLNISDDIIYFDGENGYKISRFYPNSRNCNDADWDDVQACMNVLRDFHEKRLIVSHEFSLRERINFYEGLCTNPYCIHFEDYSEVRTKMNELLDFTESLNIPKYLTHIDSVFANFLILPDKSIRLIDWEYAGMSDQLTDIAMFAIYSYYDEAQLDKLMKLYFCRTATREERLRIYSYVALSGFLWALWAEYKSSVGEEFGDYTLKMYRYAKDYYKKVKQLLTNE